MYQLYNDEPQQGSKLSNLLAPRRVLPPATCDSQTQPQAAQPCTASRLGPSSIKTSAPSTLSVNDIPHHLQAAAMPAYRALLRGHEQHHLPGTHQLPHVQPVGDGPSTSYSSLDGLKKLGELYKGKHSTVTSYIDSCTGRLVVVKTYYKRTMAKRHYRNVRREISISRLLAKQRFTGAVQLLGAFEDDSHIYLVQESCGGGDLYRRLVRAGGQLAEADVCRDVVVPLLLTLTFLHASHIAHRDIKPENIMFTADGGLRLGDFGLSIDARLECPTSRVGTLDYMAPEVVGMPSPDDMQRLGLAPHQVGHYGCKVDVWAVGILTYELICGRPPFEVEDVKVTEKLIKFSEVDFPPHMSPSCRSFIQQALTKRAESRPSAAQLFQHPWVQAHYRQLLADQRPALGAAAAAAALACTPELRRTVSQPPSPSKSMPADQATGRQGAAAALTPTAAAMVLPPFLPLSQAKMAYKVQLLSAGAPPSSGVAVRARRRVSDPLARVLLASPAAAPTAAAAAAEAPPSTPPPAAAAAAPACVSDDAGATAAGRADMRDDAASSSTGAAQYETPGTPGLKTTPLHRQRPVVQQRPLGRTPFLLPLATSAGSGGGSGGTAGELQSLGAAMRKAAAPARSRFGVAAENDESHATLATAGAGQRDASNALNPALHSRTNSFSSFGGAGSSGNLAVQARANSFTAFGGSLGGNSGDSSGNLQLQARASSFTSFGGSSSNLSNTGSLGGSRPSSKQLQLSEDPAAGETAAGAAEEEMLRLQLR